jgi:hypothetical protein
MKGLAICVLALTLSLPATARADAHPHRLTVAGALLTAVGGAMAIVGASLVSYGALNPPPPPDVFNPQFCAIDGCNGLPHDSTNGPLVAGAPILALGGAALGSGIALLVVGKRGERASVSLAANGLRVRF